MNLVIKIYTNYNIREIEDDDYYKGYNDDYLNMVKTYNSFNNFYKSFKKV